MKHKTKLVKLYSESIEVRKKIKPIRLCNRKCTIIGNKVFSYDTLVARIDWVSKALYVPERSFFYSQTTTKQLKEVTNKFNLVVFSFNPDRPIKKGEYTHSFTY
jgi:hypothetical protein